MIRSAARWLLTHPRSQTSNYRVLETSYPVEEGLRTQVSDEYLALIDDAYVQGDCLTAEKLLRWSLLVPHGGVAVDMRIAVPKSPSAAAGFEALLSLRGSVVLTAQKPQNTRALQSGITATNSLLLTSKEHPILRALLDTIPANVKALRKAVPNAGPAYTAGHILLTRMLNGSFTVLPRSFVDVIPENLNAY